MLHTKCDFNEKCLVTGGEGEKLKVESGKRKAKKLRGGT